jgi:anti-sigma regulatory factor (Ser/Thr protein kinase)
MNPGGRGIWTVMSGTGALLAVELPSAVDAPAAARRMVHQAVEPLLHDPREGDLLLLTSELVTNAVRHAEAPREAPIRLEVTTDGQRLRVAVFDRGRGIPERVPEVTQGSGWGFRLVDQLAERWGTWTQRENCVWFEFDLDRPEMA